MANSHAVMAVIRSVRPPFRNNHDKVAFAVHATILASGFVLTATGRPAFADDALSSPPTQGDVGIDGWNEFDKEYAFVYKNTENGSKKILVKCLAIDDKLFVDAIADGGAEPAHLEIEVGNYARESRDSSQFKHLSKLVADLRIEILDKLDGRLKPTSSRTQSRMNLTPFKRDIDELIDEFVEGDLTTFADMKRVWLSRKFSYIYEAFSNTNLAFFIQSLYAHTIGHMISIDSFSRRLGGLYCLYCLHEIQPFKPKFRIYISLQELGKFRDLIVEAKDKGVEIAAAVAKQMLDKNMFIFGAVDFNEASATKKTSQLAEIQKAYVRVAYQTLFSGTEIEQFIHLDMGNEVDLSSLQKMSTEYAEAKKRAIKCAGEIVEVEDIKHIAEEKELMGERVEKLKEEWDSQRHSFYEQTKLDSLTTTQKLLTNGEHDEDDGFDELDRLLLQS